MTTTAGGILVAGGTGFIGRALVARLRAQGERVVRGGRTVGVDTVRCDLDDSTSMEVAMRACRAAVYLVHGLKRGAGYEAWEEAAAGAFVDACAAAQVSRIVYLGGPDPGPGASAHLRARLRTGAVLRERGAAAGLEVVELRAAMIIGAGSDSFRLVRDLAMRLPFLVAAPWLDALQAPVAREDVVVALQTALGAGQGIAPGVYGVPGPEVISGRALMLQIRKLAGLPAPVLEVPWGSRRAAGAVAAALTRVDGHLVRELVDGMGRGDLVSRDVSVWSRLPRHPLIPLQAALVHALAEDDPGWPMLLVEGVMGALVRRAWGAP